MFSRLVFFTFSGMPLPIHGHCFIRNGLKYDYPFRECLLSLAGICETIELALGKSDDGTEAAVQDLPKLHILPTVWDEELRKGGQILSQQTNLALDSLRARVPTGWVIALQADEIISEREYPQLIADLEQAEREGCDAISFCYLHFWQSYNAIAFEWRWYPHEIRAFRIDSKIESYGDAQSFRGWKKLFYSNAHIFHYGHVRDANAYEKKKTEFHRWWHSDAEMKRVIEKGNRRDRKEPVLPYLGPHPSVMNARIPDQRTDQREITIFGDRESFSEDFLRQIQARARWVTDESALPDDWNNLVFLREPSLWFRLKNFIRWGREIKIPTKMKSPQARDWTPEFRAIMQFSAKGIAVR